MTIEDTETPGRISRLTGSFRALGYGPFALLWSGQAISRLGDNVYRIALAWWVLEKTGSATAMGTVLIFSFTPMLIFLLLGGIAVDRFPRAQLMIVSDLLRGVIVTIVSILALLNMLSLWHIYVVSMVFGFASAFFQPAYQAIIPDLLPAPLLPSANALTSLSVSVITIIGPGIGAAIVHLSGTSLAFGINAASFLISAICIVPLRRRLPPIAAQSQAQSVVGDLREGLQTVLGIPWLWITIGLFALVNITHTGPYSVALPFLVKDVLKQDVDLLGMIYAASGIGALLVAVWLGRLEKLRRRGISAYGAVVICGFAVLSMGLPIGSIGVIIASFINGVGITAFGLIWTNMLQELVPRERLGRVVSIDLLGSFVLLPVGYGLTGLAADHIGTGLIFIIGGALTVGLMGLGLLHPSIRGLD